MQRNSEKLRAIAKLAGARRGFAGTTGVRLLYVPVARGYASIEQLADRVTPLDEVDGAGGERPAGAVGGWL